MRCVVFVRLCCVVLCCVVLCCVVLCCVVLCSVLLFCVTHIRLKSVKEGEGRFSEGKKWGAKK